MRSWVKDPEILEDPQDLTLTSLFKSMVYDYMYADLDPIERAVITYILVNWREMHLNSGVREDVEEITNRFVQSNPTQIANDFINAVVNVGMIQERIEYLNRLDK